MIRTAQDDQNCLLCHGEFAKSGYDASSMSLAIRVLHSYGKGVDHAGSNLINNEQLLPDPKV